MLRLTVDASQCYRFGKIVRNALYLRNTIPYLGVASSRQYIGVVFFWVVLVMNFLLSDIVLVAQ